MSDNEFKVRATMSRADRDERVDRIRSALSSASIPEDLVTAAAIDFIMKTILVAESNRNAVNPGRLRAKSTITNDDAE